jgi:hypothetical protein
MDIEKVMRAFSISRGAESVENTHSSHVYDEVCAVPTTKHEQAEDDSDFFSSCCNILQTATSWEALNARWMGMRNYWSEHLSEAEMTVLDLAYQNLTERLTNGTRMEVN